MSTLKTTNLQNASAASPAFVLASDGSATANLSSVNGGPIAGTRNRIINGDMRIDQRNAGASVSGTSGVFSVDRWKVQNNSGSARFNIQQNAGSVTPPTGFKNYLGVTSTGAYSIVAGDVISVVHVIEGNNISDLGWGASGASAVMLSFWVRSSLTGTFGGSVKASGATSYPFTFAISAAGTWEYKTVAVNGPTSGTFATDNSAGIEIYWSMGTGSTFNGTAGAWAAADYRSVTGATSVVGTNGATFYITGVQLEPGSTATPFERRSFGQELALCQRYYAKTYSQGTVPGTATDTGAITSAAYSAIAYASAGTWQFPVTMRATATVTLYSTVNANTTGKVSADSVDGTGSVAYISDRSAFIVRQNDSTGVGASTYMKAHAIASAEL